MKKEPTVNEAKALAKKHGKTGIIIFHFDDNRMGYASYGNTRSECAYVRKLADAAYEVIHEKASVL